MGKSLFIIGAGCSVEAGVPMMQDFLERSADLLHAKKVETWRNQFELVLKARASLSETHSKSTGVDIHNLEAVLSAFEMGKTLGKIPGLDPLQIEEISQAYRTVIAKTVEHTLNFLVENSSSHPRIADAKPYGSFAEMLKIIRASDQSFPAVISFNYDLALDRCLGTVDYGLDES